MSGVLNRLVARATGAATSGVRARMPARFEGAGLAEDGFSVVSEDVPAAAAGIALSGPNVAQKETVDRGPVDAPTAGAEPIAESPLDDPPIAAYRPEALLHEPLAQPDMAHSSEDSALSSVMSDPSIAASEDGLPEPQTLDLLTEVSGPLPERAEAPDRAPVPMLPRDQPLESSENAPVSGLKLNTSQMQAPPAANTVPQAPDITIHIGRIELRSEAARPPKPKRAARQSSMPTLADYLKGGAG